jgi:hypothetical protein
MKCRTFTHHVGTTKTEEAIRVECVAHPRWIVDAVKTGDLSARQVAAAAQAQHEADGEAHGEDPADYTMCVCGQIMGHR